nr:geranylgeranyl reductase family protein [Chloroflexota bacterium]
MISVDVRRCAYCGSCVSVCPVNALDLQETRLVVTEDCIECNLCLSACPMGALLPAGEQPQPYSELKDRYDVVVIGAGPAGAVAAWEAAKQGLAVLLLEKRQEIGSPVRCAEGIAHQALSEFIAPDERWISARICKAHIVLVEDGQECVWESEALPEGSASAGVGYVLERRVFDRVLAERAAQAGARVLVKTAATGLLREGEAVVGVRAQGPWGQRDIAARVVIGADGVESRVGVWAGLDTTLLRQDLMTCAQFLLAGIEVDPQCTYYYLDRQNAPGGYVWIFPKGEGRANVGLGIQADLATVSPVEALTRFVERHPFLAKGSIVTLVVGGVPVGLPPSPMVADGLMLVGDAARQVDPLTGGGIANGMAAGRLAAKVAAEAIAAGDVSRQRLSRYEQEWAAGIGREIARNYRLRARFPPEQRVGERFLHLFALSIGAGK